MQVTNAHESAATASPAPFYRSRAVWWILITLLLFAAAQEALFRADWNSQYLEPNSSAGTVESYLHWLLRSKPARVPEVMVVGDSRVAEGFSAGIAGRAAGNRLRFWNFGLAGTTPRVWYYVLRDADPGRNRFAAIVIALDRYSDQEFPDRPDHRIIDLNFVVKRLRITDCYDFAVSMNAPDLRSRALSGCLLPGLPLREDVKAFLRDPADRLDRAADWWQHGLGYTSGYAGGSTDLTGLSADFNRRTINFPPGLSDAVRNGIAGTVFPQSIPQTGAVTQYRRLWFSRILDLYKGSKTKIVFFELPRAPLPVPDSPVPPAALQWVLSQPRVSAFPVSAFRDLEQPEFFLDGLHLNKRGRPLLSERIGGKLADLLPPH